MDKNNLPKTPFFEMRNVEDVPNKYLESNSMTKEILKEKGQLVSECMLSSYWGIGFGLAMGVFLARRRKDLKPFVFWVGVGSIGDYAHCYYNKCRELLQDYNQAEEALKKMERDAKAIVNDSLQSKDN